MRLQSCKRSQCVGLLFNSFGAALGSPKSYAAGWTYTGLVSFIFDQYLLVMKRKDEAADLAGEVAKVHKKARGLRVKTPNI